MQAFRKFVHEHCRVLLSIWRFAYALRISWYRCLERRKIRQVQTKLDAVVANLSHKVGKIRVGFFVYNGAVFQTECVFKRMLNDPLFDPFIVVTWSENFASQDRRTNDWNIHCRTVTRLRAQYTPEKVFDACEEPADFAWYQRCDIAFVMRPYDDLLCGCKIATLAQHGVPIIYSHYGFEGGDIADEGVFKMTSLGYLWRYYTGSTGMRDLYNRLQPIAGKKNRVVLSGNPKYEQIADYEKIRRERKRVLICPHHTIDPEESFYISNFVRFADFLVELPHRYPQIDWVFRPHPNLMSKMVTHGYWSEGQREAYLAKWQAYDNVEYQSGGDYYSTFVNSDAIIQDCSSFLAEYHVTGHPQCYMIKSEEHAKTQYNGLGYELLRHTYHAIVEQDIIDFVENVVLAGHDPMKAEREAFLKDNLMLNYPFVSKVIIDDIKKALGRS